MTHRNDYIMSPSSQSYDPYAADLFTILMVIWYRKFIVLLTLILGVVGALFLISSVQPRYTADGSFLINLDVDYFSPEQLLKQKKTSIFDIGPILTEIELLKSRKMAAKVVERLNLTNDPYFQIREKGPREKESAASFTKKADDPFRSLAVEGTDFKTLPPEAIDPKVSAAVTNLVDSLRVVSIPGSLAVKIIFTSPDSNKSASIVNTYINEYIALKQSTKLEAQDRVTSWLEDRLKTLRKNLLEAETEIEELKIKNKLIPDKQEAISTRQILNMNDQYARAQEEYSELKSQLDQLSKAGNESLLSVVNSNVLNTSFIRQLQSQKVELETRVNDLSNRYGPKHPNMIKTLTELNDVKAAINAEYQKAKNIIRNELNASQKRIKEIEHNIEGEMIEENQDVEALATLQDLEREAEASRLVLKTFLDVYKRSIGKTDLLESSIDVISYAARPTEPSYPNKVLLLSLSIFVSLLFGVFLAFIFERLSLNKK